MEFSIKEVDIIDCFSDITYNATILYDEYVYIINGIDKIIKRQFLANDVKQIAHNVKIYFADKEDTSYDGYIIRKDGTLKISMDDGITEKEIEPNKVLVELLHYDDEIFKTGQVIKYTDFNDDDKKKNYTVKTISETEDSTSYEREFELTGSLFDRKTGKKEEKTFHLKVTDNGSTLKENEEDEYDIEDYSVKEADIPSSEGYKLKL